MQKQPASIGSTPGEIGGHIAAGMKATGRGADKNKGLHYWYNYRDDFPDAFEPKWQYGYTASQRFNPRLPKAFTFYLNPRESASAGLKEWLGGLTIADCASVSVALQFDAIRAALGDERFDKLFDADNPFYINQAPLQNQGLAGYLKDTAKTAIQPGDLFYFRNHKHYPYKHHAGAWSGENAVYLGGDRWSGFGAQSKTEEHMMETILKAYNDDPDEADRKEMQRKLGKKDPITLADYRYGEQLEGVAFLAKYATVADMEKSDPTVGKQATGIRVNPDALPKAPAP